MSDTRVVAVLGAGALGVAMAARLGERGYQVRLWNRTAERARAGAANSGGVVAVETTVEATLGASAVITVLRDGGAVASVMATAIAEMPADAVWVQASTVGPRSAGTLADLARSHGVAYLDAPVSGSTTPAREGKLVWLVAGEDAALDRARPVLDALGSSVLHVGTGVEGSALKLAVNAWMTAATVAMSDVLALCDALGVDHATFVRALEAGPLAMPYELQKVGVMDAGTYTAGFAVELALKDINLAAELAEPSPLLKVVHDRLERASSAGHGGDDVAAVDYARRQT
jgi:3-hydroxyisobutyrate dehydrogenase-like beta-hydroxyacid dehydrogenase